MLWTPIKELAESPYGADAVIDPDGNVTVVWSNFAPPREIMAVRQPAGGRWGTPLVIGHGWHPKLAIDDHGSITAAWLSMDGPRMSGVQAARWCEEDVGWSEPVALEAGTPTSYASSVAVAANASGDVVIAWAVRRDPCAGWRIRAVWRGRHGPWNDVSTLTPEDGSECPSVGIDVVGRAVVLYGRQTLSHPGELFERVRQPGGRWSEPMRIAAEGYSPVLAVDPAGNATVIYSPDFSSVEGATRSLDGPWRRVEQLGPRDVDWYALSAGQHDTAVVATSGSSAGGWIDLVEKSRDGGWSTPERLMTGDYFGFLALATNQIGDVFLAWGYDGLDGSYRPAGGTWSTPITLSTIDEPAGLESVTAKLARNGDVVVLWKREEQPLKVRIMRARAASSAR